MMSEIENLLCFGPRFMELAYIQEKVLKTKVSKEKRLSWIAYMVAVSAFYVPLILPGVVFSVISCST